MIQALKNLNDPRFRPTGFAVGWLSWRKTGEIPALSRNGKMMCDLVIIRSHVDKSDTQPNLLSRHLRGKR